MNYELLQELMDANFPGAGSPEEGGYHYPTLEELIDACGDGLQSLINNRFNDRGGWVAFTNHKDETGERMNIYGATPSEAVAKLWLALQKQ